MLSRPASPARGPWFPGDSVYRDLGDEAAVLAEALIDGIRRQQGSFVGDEAAERLVVAIFDALTALFDRAASEGTESPPPLAYRAFREAIAEAVGASHDVADYAANLGYSARTLSRACHLATGHSAKAVLSDRLVLEAKRLLVDTDLPAAAVATELGFTEAGNFGRSFTRLVGTSPGRFRRRTTWSAASAASSRPSRSHRRCR